MSEKEKEGKSDKEEGRVTVAVVDLALGVIGQDFVRALNLLEFGGVTALIRVLLHREFAVGLLDSRGIVILVQCGTAGE